MGGATMGLCYVCPAILGEIFLEQRLRRGYLMGIILKAEVIRFLCVYSVENEN